MTTTKVPCPNCDAYLTEQHCKLLCERCRTFFSCNDGIVPHLAEDYEHKSDTPRRIYAQEPTREKAPTPEEPPQKR